MPSRFRLSLFHISNSISPEPCMNSLSFEYQLFGSFFPSAFASFSFDFSSLFAVLSDDSPPFSRSNIAVRDASRPVMLSNVKPPMSLRTLNIACASSSFARASRLSDRKLTAAVTASIDTGRASSIAHLPSGSSTSVHSPFSSTIAPPSGFVSLSIASPSSARESSSGFQFRFSAHSRIEPQISRNTVRRLFATFHTDWTIRVPLSPSFHASLIFFASEPKAPTIFCVISSISSSVFCPVPFSQTVRKLS